MFSYYRRASWCIAYLEDVGQIQGYRGTVSFAHSCWSRRSWTLQELIDPDYITFYAQDWTELSTKHALVSELHTTISIDTRTLRGQEWMKPERIGSRLHVLGSEKVHNEERGSRIRLTA